MDSNVVRIILTFGVGAVWKEIDEKCTRDETNLFASSVLTFLAQRGKNKILVLMYKKTEMTGESDICS